MAKANTLGAKIHTADLYGLVVKRCGGAGYSHCEGFQLENNVHFTTSGWKVLAAEMHSALRSL
jgi:hypothetical protein